MKRLATAFAAISLLVLLATCDSDLTADLYVRDIVDLANGTVDRVFTSATISVESPGSDSAAEVEQYIRENFRDANNFRVESRNYTDFVLSDIKIPVVNADTTNSPTEPQDLFALLVRVTEAGSAEFGIAVNNGKFTRISRHAKDEYYQDVSVSDMRITLRVSNDTRSEAAVLLSDVYANQNPLPFEHEYLLSPRDVVELRFSDVLRDYAFRQGSVYLGEIPSTVLK